MRWPGVGHAGLAHRWRVNWEPAASFARARSAAVWFLLSSAMAVNCINAAEFGEAFAAGARPNRARDPSFQRPMQRVRAARLFPRTRLHSPRAQLAAPPQA